MHVISVWRSDDQGRQADTGDNERNRATKQAFPSQSSVASSFAGHYFSNSMESEASRRKIMQHNASMSNIFAHSSFSHPNSDQGGESFKMRVEGSGLRCSICGKFFRSKELLCKHKEIVHKNTDNSFRSAQQGTSTSTVVPSSYACQRLNADAQGASASDAMELELINSVRSIEQQQKGQSCLLGPGQLPWATVTFDVDALETSQSVTNADLISKSVSHPSGMPSWRFSHGQDGADPGATVKDQRAFVCGQCGSTFTSKVALNDHVDSMHSRKGFRCNACGMVFKWRTYVYQHRFKCVAHRMKTELS